MPLHDLPAPFSPVILLLASGRGERFKASGGLTHKLDADLLGLSVLERAMRNASATGLAVHVERNSHAGMGDCIAAAVRSTPNPFGWLILPADMPLVPVAVILEVARNLQDASIAMPLYSRQRGHPVGFSKACEPDLLGLRGDTGARTLLSLPHLRTKKIHVDHLPQAQGCLIDVDTVEDLQRAKVTLCAWQATASP